MWSISDLGKVRLLIQRGANVNGVSKLTGRTPLVMAAGRAGSIGIVRLLLDKGADPNVVDKQGISPVLAAAANTDSAVLKLLLDHGVNPNVNVKAKNSMPPLSLAAFVGNRSNVELLLSRGADAKAIAPGGFTVLMSQMAVSDLTMFRTLVKSGADPRQRSIIGLDAMMTAATSETSDPRVVRELIQLGLDPTVGARNLHADHGYGSGLERPLDWASRQGGTPTARALAEFTKEQPQQLPLHAADQRPALKAESPRAAIEKALPLLYEGGREFFKRSGCTSCHHNMLPAVAFSVARLKGIAMDEDKVRRNSQQSVAWLKGNQQTLLQGVLLPGGDLTTAYLLWGLAADGYPRDRATDAAVYHLAESQGPDGHWRALAFRPPIESSPVTATAIAIRALGVYSIPQWRRDFQDRVRRAAKWLATYAPRTGEEKSMRLLGLTWAGAEPQTVRVAAEQLIAARRADGGWAQLDTLPSDAYATGQALYALGVAGHLPKHLIEEGVRFLLNTQLEDGSWHVSSRSYPVQANYFDTGFPHARDQWVSAAGTSWACLGLSVAIETKSVH
jgi:ankyrin repeat protein